MFMLETIEIDMIQIKKIVEGLLMVAQEPLKLEELARIINSDNKIIENNELKDVLKELAEDYAERGIQLQEVASGYRFQLSTDLSSWISRMLAEKPPRYSRALLETLSIIAYKQPVTRAEIEDIRGVAVSTGIMKTLLDHEWVHDVGCKEVPGRPTLYATTKKFLDYFNLKSLDNLPVFELETLLMQQQENMNNAITGLSNIEDPTSSTIVENHTNTESTDTENANTNTENHAEDEKPL